MCSNVNFPLLTYSLCSLAAFWYHLNVWHSSHIHQHWPCCRIYVLLNPLPAIVFPSTLSFFLTLYPPYSLFFHFVVLLNPLPAIVFQSTLSFFLTLYPLLSFLPLCRSSKSFTHHLVFHSTLSHIQNYTSSQIICGDYCKHYCQTKVLISHILVIIKIMPK